MRLLARLALTLSTSCLLLLNVEAARAAAWSDALQQQIERLDRETPGTLGVYVKRLDNGETFDHGADQSWYLGSTVKVLVAIAVLQQVDAGKLRLNDSLTLQAGDKIEAGQLVWSKVGSRFTVDLLLKRMLGESDNTAANMLIRAIGEDRLNESAKDALGARDFHRLTTLAAVRYDVYAELHPDARKLSNDQLVRIASAKMGPARVEAVRRALGVKASDLKVRTIDEAYDRYYAHQLNTTTLEAYGAMLEKLARGQLLKPQSTQRLFTDMKFDIYTGYRLQAGFPKAVHFIHKTGTQYQRACHMGVIHPQDDAVRGIVVAVCTAGLDEQDAAGPVFEKVGAAINAALLTPTSTASAAVGRRNP